MQTCRLLVLALASSLPLSGCLAPVPSEDTPSTAPAIAAIAAGEQHSVLVSVDGAVFVSGNNSDGQLGLPESTPLLEQFGPLAVPEVLDAEAGALQSFLRHADGSVSAFGWNGGGRLGLGAGADTRQFGPAPVQATGLQTLRSGGGHTLAIDANGDALGWGVNSSGEVGVGSTGDIDTPTGLPVLSDVIGIDAACGGGSSAAVTVDGRVYTWGLNGAGQLGLPGPGAVNPSLLATVEGALDVAVGETHMLALLDDGTVVSWGSNSSGQLGLGATSSLQPPTPVPGLSDVVAIDAGIDWSLALDADGVVWVWGDGGTGVLGDGFGGPTSSATPLAVSGLDGVVSVVAGSFHLLALTAEGRVWGWGLSDMGQLGLGLEELEEAPVLIF